MSTNVSKGASGLSNHRKEPPSWVPGLSLWSGGWDTAQKGAKNIMLTHKNKTEQSFILVIVKGMEGKSLAGLPLSVHFQMKLIYELGAEKDRESLVCSHTGAPTLVLGGGDNNAAVGLT